MKLVQKDVTSVSIPFLMVSEVDHITGSVGKTVTLTISKNGSAFAAPSGSVVEIGNGWYRFEPDAADVNALGKLLLHAEADGCDPVDLEVTVVAFDPYDPTRLGLAALPNAAAAANGGLPTVDGSNAVKVQTGTGANQIDLNNGAVRLQATTHTGAVIPTVTSVTNDVGITQAGADKVWASASRTLTSFGTLVSDIWNFGTRTLTAIGNVTLADGAITAAKIADGALTAAKFGAGAFDAVWERATSALTTAGTIGKLLVDNINATIASRLAASSYVAPDNAGIAAIKSQTDQLAFTSGDVHATLAGEAVTVGTNNDKMGYSLSPAGVQAIWDFLTSGIAAVGSIGKRIVDFLDVAVSTRLASSSYVVPPSAAAIRAEIDANSQKLDVAVSTRATPAQVNQEVDTAIADARLNELLAAAMTTQPAAGSLFGELTEDDGGVQRFTANALEQAPSGSQIAAADVWTYPNRALTDKTGFELSPAGIQAIWDFLTSGIAAVGSIGKHILDNLNAAVSTRLAATSYVAPDNSGIAAIKAKTDNLAFTGSDVRATLDGEPVTVGTNNDKTGYDLSATSINAIWNVLANGLNVAGSIGKRIVDFLDVAVSSRLASTSYTPPPSAAAIRAEIDANSQKLDVPVGTRLASSAYVAPDNAGISNLNNKLTTQRATKLDHLDADVSSRSSHSVADIWNALISGMSVQGSVGKQIADNLNAPVGTRLAASNFVAPDNAGISNLNNKLTTQRAAKLDHLDADVSSRLAASAYVAPDNNTISTIANRIGAFAGSGTNTVLGFLRAIMRSDASTPTDVGGTYSPATDSLQAIRDRGDVAWGAAPSAVADAVWDALLASHVDPDTIGAAIGFLYEKVSRVGGVKFITAIDPTSNQLTLVDGKDYTVDSGLPLEWESDKFNLAGANVTLKMWVKSSHEVVLTKQGSVVQDSNPARVRVELTADDTGGLQAGVSYEYDVDVVLANGAKIAFVPISPVKVLPDVR